MASGPHRVTLDIGVYGARGIPSTYSGYETFLTTLLPELVDRGHSVTMYCRTGEGIEAGPMARRRSTRPSCSAGKEPEHLEPRLHRRHRRPDGRPRRGTRRQRRQRVVLRDRSAHGPADGPEHRRPGVATGKVGPHGTCDFSAFGSRCRLLRIGPRRRLPGDGDHLRRRVQVSLHDHSVLQSFDRLGARPDQPEAPRRRAGALSGHRRPPQSREQHRSRGRGRSRL